MGILIVLYLLVNSIIAVMMMMVPLDESIPELKPGEEAFFLAFTFVFMMLMGAPFVIGVAIYYFFSKEKDVSEEREQDEV